MASALSTVFSFFFFVSLVSGVDFLLDPINSGDLILVGDARFESAAVRLTNDSNQFSLGRAFFPTKLSKPANSSFSTSFVFSILPKDPSNPGFGLAFVLSSTTAIPGLAGQYFGLFSDNTTRTRAPLLAVEFDTGRNPEFRELDGNHVGIDLNFIESSAVSPAGYYRRSAGAGEEFVPVNLRSGENIRAWIDFSGPRRRIEVSVAPADLTQKPIRPLISYSNPDLAGYLSDEMFVGFSASKTQWVEAQRILAWSFRDGGAAAVEINTTGLPVFVPAAPPSSSSPATALIAGLSSAAVVIIAAAVAWILLRRRRLREEEEIEEWELEYWPHRFSYAELAAATGGFSPANLVGFGGFGNVYRGVLLKGPAGEESMEVAVKCVSHDSKQGLKEFMAEISSTGRLRHKNLVQIRGWCRKSKQLILVYDFMKNGSLSRWIFGEAAAAPTWEARKRVLLDVAEGLEYLHHGCEELVLHRDVKPSNILLDEEMNARLGDFGLAKLQQHGEAPSRTRVVGTVGYLAPELAKEATPAAAGDVYSFGVVAMEVACGRRPVEMGKEEEEDFLLVEWVRRLYEEGRLMEAADQRLRGDFKVEEMELVLKLGLACCHPDPAQRPSMKEVVALLTGAQI